MRWATQTVRRCMWQPFFFARLQHYSSNGCRCGRWPSVRLVGTAQSGSVVIVGAAIEVEQT